MRAILLNAGMGTRLWPITHYFPKAFLNVGTKLLIDHQLDALYANNVFDIEVVVGHLDWMFEKRFPDLRYIQNKYYAETNTIYSLRLALEQDCSTTLIINGDVYFTAEHIERLMRAGNCALVEYKILDPEAMKVKTSYIPHIIDSIGKDIKEAAGEAVGLYRIESEFAEKLLQQIRGMPKDLYYEDAMNKIIDGMVFKPIGVKDIIEIDTEADLIAANKLYQR